MWNGPLLFYQIVKALNKKTKIKILAEELIIFPFLNKCPCYKIIGPYIILFPSEDCLCVPYRIRQFHKERLRTDIVFIIPLR